MRPGLRMPARVHDCLHPPGERGQHGGGSGGTTAVAARNPDSGARTTVQVPPACLRRRGRRSQMLRGRRAGQATPGRRPSPGSPRNALPLPARRGRRTVCTETRHTASSGFRMRQWHERRAPARHTPRLVGVIQYLGLPPGGPGLCASPRGPVDHRWRRNPRSGSTPRRPAPQAPAPATPPVQAGQAASCVAARPRRRPRTGSRVRPTGRPRRPPSPGMPGGHQRAGPLRRRQHLQGDLRQDAERAVRCRSAACRGRAR